MPYALLSVFDKTGLEEFARGLADLGWDLLASTKTAKYLRSKQLKVTEIAEYTHMPELLDGRVKTLHPAIYSGLLAKETPQDREILAKFSWEYINLVAVNLYPFFETIQKLGVRLESAIEQIDIGGVSLIRASAKNFERVILVMNPSDYPQILNKLKMGHMDMMTRKRLARDGFALTSQYDLLIAHYLSDEQLPFQQTVYPSSHKLRYGENPHQSAQLFTFEAGKGLLGGRLLQGESLLSYNNALDLDAAWKIVKGFIEPAACVVKHLSPCGVATSYNIADAIRGAWAADPLSAYGGVVASNRLFDGEAAKALKSKFIECVVAPQFTEHALSILSHMSRCRILEMPQFSSFPPYETHAIQGGLLKQEMDEGDPVDTVWKVVSKRNPTSEEAYSLQFAWHVCQYVKSNAIVLAKGDGSKQATVGIGGGQPNRIDCLHIAARCAQQKSQGAVLASDAFFPFDDVIMAAAEYGISAIVQPGGSRRDGEVIAAVDRFGLVLFFTGVRHLKH